MNSWTWEKRFAFPKGEGDIESQHINQLHPVTTCGRPTFLELGWLTKHRGARRSNHHLQELPETKDTKM